VSYADDKAANSPPIGRFNQPSHFDTGSVASFHLRGVPLCCSTKREVEEQRDDELQGELT